MTNAEKIIEWIIDKAQDNCDLCKKLNKSSPCICNKVFSQFYREHPDMDWDNPPKEILEKASKLCEIKLKKTLEEAFPS